ncbi:MAG TPA: hypothetical protein VFV88_00300 [Steroidobacteraceae bacterium]|jgi:hypothetical protein|nr:hypothetical protein [Steroidobacteraceae bacterium]
MTVRLVAMLLACAALAGCAVGQKFSYADGYIALLANRSDTPTAVAVLDQRPYILSRDKRENFVGLSRGGYGNPFNVTTKSGAPMAADMAAGIVRALEANGQPAAAVIVLPAEGIEGAKERLKFTRAERQLLFILREWKTDTYEHTGLWFDVTLDVYDESGETLASKQISGKEVSGGSIVSAEKDAQKWFSEKVGQLLDNRDVAAALK